MGGGTGTFPNLVDWAEIAGIEGGIPERMTLCADLTSLDNTGMTDVRAQIQAAIDACPPGQTVHLPAGIFRVDRVAPDNPLALSMRSGVTLRGEGAATILRTQGMLHFSAGLGKVTVDLTDDALVGATSFTLAMPPPGLTVGSTVLLNDLDEPSYVHPYGYEENATAPLHCTYCDEPDQGTRVRSQMVRVTAVDGNQVTFTPALYSPFTVAREARILYPQAADTGPNVLTYAGVEDLTLDLDVLPGMSPGWVVRFEYAQNCWLRGVEVEVRANAQAAVGGYFAHRIAILHGRFSGHAMTSQSILTQPGTEGWLVEDNLFEDVTLTFLNAGRQGGHVFAYNVLSRYKGPTTALLNDHGNHGAHPQYLLFEGNKLIKHHADSIHGSSSHTTLFRNHFRCQEPDTGFGKGCVWIDSWNTRYGAIGNILGTAGMAGFVEEIESPAPIDDSLYVWRFGYSGYNPYEAFPESKSTMFRHGNYLYGTDSVTWDAEQGPTALPPSLYLKAKPGWFGDTPWPPIGPDVDGYVSPELPAERRFAARIKPSP